MLRSGSITTCVRLLIEKFVVIEEELVDGYTKSIIGTDNTWDNIRYKNLCNVIT